VLNAPGGTRQIVFDPAIPGVSERLDTVRWYRDFAADVRCTVCGLAAGCRVTPKGKASSVDRNFWLGHFRAMHPELLPADMREDL
jgi:hypothetical protein